MTPTLLGADIAAHLKIVAVATAGAAAVALVGMNAGVSETDAVGGRAQAAGTVLKAGKPTTSAVLEVRMIR